MKKALILIMILLVCSIAMAEETIEYIDFVDFESVISFGDYDSNIVSNPTLRIYAAEPADDFTSIYMNTASEVVFDINGKELIRATADGKFYINGELTKRNSTIHKAVLKWFEIVNNWDRYCSKCGKCIGKIG